MASPILAQIYSTISKKVDVSVIPIKTEYTLTESGIELMEFIRGIKYRELKWKIDNIPCGSLECKNCKL